MQPSKHLFTCFDYLHNPVHASDEEVEEEEKNEKKVLASTLDERFQKKQNFFKEVNKRKERERQALKQAHQQTAKRAKLTD